MIVSSSSKLHYLWQIAAAGAIEWERSGWAHGGASSLEQEARGGVAVRRSGGGAQARRGSKPSTMDLGFDEEVALCGGSLVVGA